MSDGKWPIRPYSWASRTKAARAYPGGLMSSGRVCHSSDEKPMVSTMVIICGVE